MARATSTCTVQAAPEELACDYFDFDDFAAFELPALEPRRPQAAAQPNTRRNNTDVLALMQGRMPPPPAPQPQPPPSRPQPAPAQVPVTTEAPLLRPPRPTPAPPPSAQVTPHTAAFKLEQGARLPHVPCRCLMVSSVAAAVSDRGRLYFVQNFVRTESQDSRDIRNAARLQGRFDECAC